MAPRLNIPPITRVLLLVLVGQSFLRAAILHRQSTPDADADSSNGTIVVPYLTLIPHLSLFYPWVLVGTSFVESNVVLLAIACATIFLGGRYLERAWSSAEFAKFVLLVSAIPNVLLALLYTAAYAVTLDISWM